MSISKDGNHLAVGGSDGKVTVVSTETLRAVQSFVCHDLPVTGLDFAPTKLTHDQGLEVLLASCSADNKISILRVYSKFSFISMVSIEDRVINLCLLLNV